MDRFAPILPRRDFTATRAFYDQLGFETIHSTEAPDYSGDLWLHFSPHQHDPSQSNWMIYLHVDEPDLWADQFRELDLPRDGIPRFGDISDTDLEHARVPSRRS